MSESQEQPKKDFEFLRFLGPLFAVFSLAWVAGLLFLTESDSFEYIKSRLDQRISFQLRQKIKPLPKINPKIKILVIDDPTVAWYKETDFSLSDWSILLQNIARNNPSVILIDKLFGGTFTDKTTCLPDTMEALANIRDIKTPIFVGAFPTLSKSHHTYQHSIKLQQDRYGIQNFVEKGAPAPKSFADLSTKIDLTKNRGRILGHSLDFEGVFAGVGHIIYNKKGAPAITPLYGMGKNTLLPHIAFNSAEKVVFKGGKLYVDDTFVPTDDKGRVYINHRPNQDFMAYRLMGPMKRAKKGLRETKVSEGDIVFIIPAFYTGNSDFHEGGPFGEIPGGFIIAATLDSIHSKRWLTVYEFDKSAIIALGVVGALAGYLSGPLSFWFITTFLGTSLFASAMGLFIFQGIVLPWSLPLFSFIGTSLFMYAFKITRGEIKRIELKKDFFKEKALRLEEEGQRRILEERLALGKAVQEMLLPKSLRGDLGAFDYQMQYKASQQMSGDWLYYWEFSATEKRIFIGDVVGKGPPAALPVAVIISTLKDAESQDLGIRSTIRLINNRLIDHFDSRVTSTLAGVALHKGNKVQFINSGSPGWFLINEGKKLNYITLRSNPLGLIKDYSGMSKTITLEKNSMFFSFTDGYMEGARAIKQLILSLNKLEFEDITHRSLHDILLRAGTGYRLEDDQTMVSIKSSDDAA